MKEHRCGREVYDGRAGSFPCYRKGPIQEDGKFWCFQHAPSKVAERRAKANKRYDDKWKATAAAKLQAENKIWNDGIEAAAKEVVERCVGMGRREIADAIRKLKK